MDLNNAIQAHAEWKVKLRAAIQKKEKMDDVKLGKEDACALGQWLHGEGRMKYGRITSFQGCMTKHAQFHRCAAGVARAINAGRYAEAESMLGAGTEYATASNAVALAVTALKKDAAI